MLMYYLHLFPLIFLNSINVSSIRNIMEYISISVLSQLFLDHAIGSGGFNFAIPIPVLTCTSSEAN